MKRGVILSVVIVLVILAVPDALAFENGYGGCAYNICYNSVSCGREVDGSVVKTEQEDCAPDVQCIDGSCSGPISSVDSTSAVNPGLGWVKIQGCVARVETYIEFETKTTTQDIIQTGQFAETSGVWCGGDKEHILWQGGVSHYLSFLVVYIYLHILFNL